MAEGERSSLTQEWEDAENFLKHEGWIVVERFGPSQFILLERGHGSHGGNSVARRIPWALLARFSGQQKNKRPSLLFTPSGSADIGTIARIFAQAPGLIIFAHPSGQAFAVIEENRVVEAAPMLESDHEWYEWVKTTQPDEWTGGSIPVWSLDKSQHGGW